VLAAAVILAAMIAVAIWQLFTTHVLILQTVLGLILASILGLLLNMLAGHKALSDLVNTTQPDESLGPEDLRAYRHFLIEYKCNALQLAVMHSSAQELDRKVLLWSIFVPQSARESSPVPEVPPEIQRRLREEGHLSKLHDEDDLAKYRERYQSSPVRPILEILNRNRLVVVVGDPGSGKSSLLKYRALQWGKDGIGPLPLLVELNVYAQNEDRKGILDYFLSGLEVPRLDAYHLQIRLKAGQAAFYLDGLDEIFNLRTRKSIMNEIATLCSIYPQTPIVVTSRKVGYDPERLRDAGFLHATLEEFDTPQITDFLDRWHLAAESSTVLRRRLNKRIVNAIGQSRAIRELAGNPLLLTMMAILNRNQELPRDRVELYKQASQVLLHEWDWNRALLFSADEKKIARQEKEKLLRILAGEMQRDEEGLAGNLIQRSRLVDIFRVFLEDLGFTDSYANALALVRQLTERNFILAYAGADRFCFVHRTFLEYYCAAWFVERMGLLEGSDGYLSLAQLRDDVFGRHWKDETWHEVLRLIVGSVHETKAGELIRYLMAQDGRYEKLANLMLAAGCLTEVRDRGSIQSTAQGLWLLLKEQAIRFDPPKAYEIYDYEKEAVPTRQAAVRWMALAWNEEGALTWLRSAAAQDWDWIVQQAAVRELARGWRDDPGTLPLLQDMARNAGNWDVREAAVQELARGWRDDPATLPLLHDRACNDEYDDPRQAAVQELARGWRDDPATLPLLYDRARNDESRDVRQAAIQELAHSWCDDPATLPLLHDRARNDKSEKVRKAVVQELVRGWKDDPQTITLLKDRVLNDEHVAVCQAAAEELARGWKDDAATLPWLQDHARNDENQYARGAAVQELARGWRDDAATLPLIKDRALNDKAEHVRKALVIGLAREWRDDPFTLPWIRERALNDDNPEVRREAVRALGFVWKDDPGTQPLLHDRVRYDENDGVRITALLRLARGWKDDPGTLPLVQDRACNDEYFEVRRKAARELTRAWKDEPRTLHLLQDRTRNDECELNRQWAVEELARGWRDDPATLPLLQDRASNDEDDSVRATAVRELASGWKDDPATLSWIQDRARNDEQFDVRKQAVWELARRWRDDPGTLPLLQERVCTDDNPDVRREAVRVLALRWKDDSRVTKFLQEFGKEFGHDISQATV
jgi:predicted NACHT family NTPase